MSVTEFQKTSVVLVAWIHFLTSGMSTNSLYHVCAEYWWNRSKQIWRIREGGHGDFIVKSFVYVLSFLDQSKERTYLFMCNWCLHRHQCDLPESFGKIDLWIANLISVNHYLAIHVIRCNVVTSQTPVVSMTTRLIMFCDSGRNIQRNYYFFEIFKLS